MKDRTTQNGFTIAIYIRFGKFLCIETNFNPFSAFELFFNQIEKKQIVGIKRIKHIEDYPDETGFVIYEIEPEADQAHIIFTIQSKFENFFEEI